MRYLALLLFLSGCATTENYEKILNSWVGESETKLVSVWGVPTSTYNVDGKKLLMFSNTGGTTTTAQPFGNSYMINSNTWWCNTTFIINEIGMVSNWRWEGNACKAK